MACCYIRRDIKISFIHSFVVHNNYLLRTLHERVPKLTGDARGLAVFRRQIAYPYAKCKARKAFLQCSVVLYG